MAVTATAGARFYISPTSVNPDTINGLSDEAAITFFETIDDWVEVEEKEDLGEIGDTSEEITFTAIRDGRVRKIKGPRNAGTQTLVVGRDPLDDGQEAVMTAQRTKFNYAFKIDMADAPTDAFTNSEIYYAGLVMGNPTNLGNVSNVTRRTFTIGINTAVYEVPSAAISP